MKSKIITIPLQDLKGIYRELCEAQKPLLKYDFMDNDGMLRQALFAKDFAISRACNFLYNKGIQQL